MVREKFGEFLPKAKLSGYAAEGEGNKVTLEDGGKKFTFIENGLEYRDIYYGFNPFIGQETVRQHGKVIWIMNCSGNASLKKGKTVHLYSFLRVALRNSRTEMPLRGPSEFRQNYYVYVNKLEGDIDSFYGQEIICADNKEVYRLQYHGGSIKD